MRTVEQLSVKETAATLGLRVETVKSRLNRARKLMREELEPALASALTDTFPFQDPRCARLTYALLARLAEGHRPVSGHHIVDSGRIVRDSVKVLTRS
jgi:RNA polymerase sigma-70 factor (ECF subfamily)